MLVKPIPSALPDDVPKLAYDANSYPSTTDFNDMYALALSLACKRQGHCPPNGDEEPGNRGPFTHLLLTPWSTLYHASEAVQGEAARGDDHARTSEIFGRSVTCLFNFVTT
jgi:hypothetical protein